MNQQYDNTNSGILTKNDKGDNPNRPDYRGSINVNGQEFWLSAWLKDGREGTKLAGQKYMSLSVEAKEQQQAPQQRQQAVPQQRQAPAPIPAGGDEFLDDIPFAQFERGTIA